MASTVARRPAFDIVVIAASAGGVRALHEVLAPLPAFFAAPILVVQHLSSQPKNRSQLAEILGARTHLDVHWAKAADRPRAGSVYIAPPGRHLLVARNGCCDISSQAPVNYACPAADPLFQSAVAKYEDRVLAVVLSGRLQDGALGAVAVRGAGGVVLAQDPWTCVAPEMPRAAIEARAVNFVLPPHAIAAALVSLVMVPGARALFGAARSAA